MSKRIAVLALALALTGSILAACGGSDDSDTPIDAPAIDATPVMPTITSFVASPSSVQAGVPTDVTWTWTYGQEPTLPDPSCTIDNGVGAVTRGQAISVTLTSVTTFTLTCTNSAGTAMRQVVVAIPPAAPVIGTFTASPATLVPGVATTVTWTWTYSNTPSPAPACMIDGVGTVTSGSTSSITQTGSRVYRLRCSNASGAGTAVANLNVDECTANVDDCQVNATCTDTPDGYTCACNNGYVGLGDVCSLQAACGVTPSLCGANSTCVNGTSCVCNPTFVGDGVTCTRMHLAFTTPATGSGQLSTWAGAGGFAGMRAADSVCQTAAGTLGLPGTYVAWMSDSLSDAYCRVHGFTGKKASNCGQATLPTGAGPWARPDATPFAPTIDRLLAPNHVVYVPATLAAVGQDIAATEKVYTGTDDSGALSGAACSDWTSSSAAVQGAMGEVAGGGMSWTDLGATDPVCSTLGHLRCVEVGSGPALPTRHPVAKKAFATSVSGTGNLSTWTDAGGLTGLAAADAICQARARFAGYANTQNFKAWLSSSSLSATSRILTNGPWARPDGVVLATTRTDLLDGRLGAPLYVTELGGYLPGNDDMGSAWTGTSTSGSLTGINCISWTSTTSTGTFGRHDLPDARWTSLTSATCSTDSRLYCFED